MMWRVMHFLQRLLLLLIVCSDRVSEISWCYGLNSEELIRRWKQPSTDNSLLLKSGVMEPTGSIGHVIEHFAEYCSSTDITSVLTGGMATFDVYDLPNMNITEPLSSSSGISVVNVNPEYDSMLAGWMVAPSVYNDTKTHFFVAWSADRNGSTAGCWDLACEGFVPVNNAPITPGDVLEPNNGQLKITIKTFKNKDDDWWLHFGHANNNLSPVEFWPKSLFSCLVDHANGITWGGYTASYTGNASPPMGNGQWAMAW